MVDDKIYDITSEISDADIVIDGKGGYLLPGMIDIHTHGAVGVHFATSNDHRKALKWFASKGVTTVIPSIATRSIDDTMISVDNILGNVGYNGGAEIGGIHFEGPFISDKKRGAMLPIHVDCNIDNFNSIYSRWFI